MTSFRKKHIKSKIHKIKPKKSIFKRLWFWIVLLFLIVIFSAFYFFLFYSGIQIKNIVISGNQKIASKDIENLISDNINNKILGIGSWEVNSKSIFLINSEKLKREILNKFPLIESVKIDKIFMQTLIFEINERVAIAVLCPSLDKTIELEVTLEGEYSENGNCYFIDAGGIIFEPVNEIPQDMVIVRQETNDAQISVGKKAVQQNIIDLVSKVEKSLKDNFQINLKTAIVISPVRLNIETKENWQIYFDLNPDADTNSQITKLNLLFSNGISADDRKNLRYIDLRPKDRAVVCDNDTCAQ